MNPDHPKRLVVTQAARIAELEADLARARTLLWQAYSHLDHIPTKSVIRAFLDAFLDTARSKEGDKGAKG